MFTASNLLASQLNRSYSERNEGVKWGGAIECEQHPSQSTFAGLSDLVPDLFGGSQNLESKGRKQKSQGYNTRNKGAKKYEVVDEEETSDQGSDFYTDSDYDQDQGDDDVEFEENVSNPKVVEEYEEMGFKGFCSDDGGDTDELES
ncbi:hypothetical protein M0R45_035738 [Rubus argutus]